MKGVLLLLFASLLTLAACDATAPDDPLPVASPDKSGGPAGGAALWGFPRAVEKSRIVFTFFDEQTHDWLVYKINADGTGRQRFDFPRDNPNDDFPDFVFQSFRWSPDGTRLVYRGSNTNTDNWYLVMVDSSATWRRLLTPIGGFADAPSWSPQGDRLLYSYGGYLGGQLGILYQTAIVDTSGQILDFRIARESRVFEGDSVFYALYDDGFNALYDAQWAPGGTHLFVTGVIGKRWTAPDLSARDIEVFKVDLATGRVVERVTRNAVSEYGFVPSPDGERLLLAQGRGADRRLYLLGVHGTVPVPLTTSPPEGLPRWAADSRHVVYQRQDTIYLLDVEDPARERLVVRGFDPDVFMDTAPSTGIERL